jgi:hypothetical protein
LIEGLVLLGAAAFSIEEEFPVNAIFFRDELPSVSMLAILRNIFMEYSSMPYFDELSLSAQTAYAQLLDSALSADHFRSIADLPGSFAQKTVKGIRYWYYQYHEPSGKRAQVFVGPDNEAVQALMARRGQPAATESLIPLARSAIALGCAPVIPRQLKVIGRLADYGFFRAGGVLVGTHAFLAYGNMLGLRWGDSSRTQDIDFAHAGKSVSLALPSTVEVKTHNAIESLEMGFLPVAGLSGKSGATYLNPKEPEFRLDFLTVTHRKGEEIFMHPQLNVPLQPLKFMEFSLENIQQAVLFSPGSAVLVSVPHPARYALHKLIVYGERAGAFAAKSMKDLHQAASLLAYYREHRPWEIDEAWADLVSRGKGWVRRAKQGVEALDKRYPDLEAGEWLTP